MFGIIGDLQLVIIKSVAHLKRNANITRRVFGFLSSFSFLWFCGPSGVWRSWDLGRSLISVSRGLTFFESPLWGELLNFATFCTLIRSFIFAFAKILSPICHPEWSTTEDRLGENPHLEVDLAAADLSWSPFLRPRHLVRGSVPSAGGVLKDRGVHLEPLIFSWDHQELEICCSGTTQ